MSQSLLQPVGITRLQSSKLEWPTTSDLKPYLSQLGSSHHCKTKNNQVHENRSIKGDYKMKSGRIYLQVVASWVWLWAQSLRTISNDSLSEIVPQYNTNFAVFLASVMLLREALAVRE